jgi:hypothetical protein
MIRNSHRSTPAWLLGLSLLLNAPTAVRADSFDVFCVPSADGISTCSGWSDGGTLTCVSSAGGVASCQSTTGKRFTCVQSSRGVTTCQDPYKTAGRAGKGDNCVFVGNGSFNCDRKSRTRPDLIPSPELNRDLISIPDDDLDLSIPSLIP